MTKRNLIIIIILLAIIDVLAACWYMTQRIEHSGKSQDLFSSRDSTEEVAVADTIGDANIADHFYDAKLRSAYFVSTSPAVASNQMSYYTSIKHAYTKWPRSINGNDSITELEHQLLKKAFNNGKTDIQDARNAYLATPTFNKPVGNRYKRMSKAPNTYTTYGNVSQVLVYPYMTSSRLLVMEIDKVEFNGHGTVRSSEYVHYDRRHQRVLERLDILNADRDGKLLNVINEKIDALNQKRGQDKQLSHAMNVPMEICCNKQGIYFEFQSGTIDRNSPIDVLIGYDKLQPFLTTEFKRLQKDNSDYWQYKKLEPQPTNVRSQQAKPVVKQQTRTTNQQMVKPAPTGTKKRSYRYKKSTRRRGYYNNRYRQQYRKRSR